MLAGVVCTPFFLEASLVLVANAIQRQRDGDDFVSREQLEQREHPQAATPTALTSAAPTPTPRT
jgi:hypothetical protein